MDKRKQRSGNAGSQRSNNAMPPQGRTPNRDNNKDDMDTRQARMDEQRELRKASLQEDPDPLPDEEGLEENGPSNEDTDRVEWDPQSNKNKNSGI